jgi:hypothetical protein
MGPNTAALYEKKAAKAAILRDTADKLKALDQAEVPKPKTAAKAKAAPKAAKPMAAKTVAKTEAPPAAPAKAPRKKKAAEE